MERYRGQKIQAIDAWRGKDEQRGDKSLISGRKNLEVTKPKMTGGKPFVDAITDKCTCMFSSPSRIHQTLYSHCCSLPDIRGLM